MELWAQDEARIGLTPIVRRVWAAINKRPFSSSNRRYEWIYVYAFVQPTTGKVEWLLLPTVNTELFQMALDYFAKAVGAKKDKQVIIVVDQAGWHFCKKLKIPKGIHLIPLPPYSPELQPSERLWPLLRESVANKKISNLNTLENIIVERCLQIRSDAELVSVHTLFDWWNNAAQHEVLTL